MRRFFLILPQARNNQLDLPGQKCGDGCKKHHHNKVSAFIFYGVWYLHTKIKCCSLTVTMVTFAPGKYNCICHTTNEKVVILRYILKKLDMNRSVMCFVMQLNLLFLHRIICQRDTKPFHNNLKQLPKFPPLHILINEWYSSFCSCLQ